MAESHGEMASVAEASSMVAALRALPWDARLAVLQCLRTSELRLWLRLVIELGPDEIAFSAMVVPTVEDVRAPIPLPDRVSTRPRYRLRRKTRVAP